MKCGFSALIALVMVTAGCRERTASPVGIATSGAPSPSASSAPSAIASAPSPSARPLPIDDAAWASMVRELSEKTGDFPSDNFVSNETSYLHVAGALDEPRLHGGAYVGVGPEQNLTYAAILEPEIAFVVDIRRDDLVLHLFYKWLFTTSDGRGDLVAKLTSRVPDAAPRSPDASLDDLALFTRKTPRDAALEKRTIDDVASFAEARGSPLDARDRKFLATMVRTFARDGLDLRYSMVGSARKYPSLAEIEAIPDDAGRARSFLASEHAFRVVQRLERENRIVPVVGDFAGDGALLRIADELRRRKIPLRVFYSSNVEQYVFSPPDAWRRWIRNLSAMPWSDDGVIVRVYFDQGRAHPLQRKGERTTSLVVPAHAFLARAEHPFASWWDVATTTFERDRAAR